MRQGMLKTVFVLATIGMVANVSAQDNDKKSLIPSFKLQRNENLLNPNLSSALGGDAEVRYSTNANSPESSQRSYDAIFYYPLHRRGVTIDLGVNIRLQEDASKTGISQTRERDWLNIDPSETRTRIHAAAVFDLPFNGLKAGVSGSYEPSIENLEYDYEAKLSYKWKNGFGLQGGWQHQQLPLEQQNLNDALDVQTLFLDLNYRF